VAVLVQECLKIHRIFFWLFLQRHLPMVMVVVPVLLPVLLVLLLPVLLLPVLLLLDPRQFLVLL
jgi:hypothetical protein